MKLHEILKSSFSARESEMGDSVKFTSYEAWDSMAHMLFITQLEDGYGIQLTGDEIASMDTIGKAKEIIRSRGKEL
jgi:acyl carrier protein